MTDHDSQCISQDFLPPDLTRFCDCERVARIRADERAKDRRYLLVRAEVTTDLRAEVKAQRDQFMRVTKTPPDHPMTRIYADVLALLGKEKP